MWIGLWECEFEGITIVWLVSECAQIVQAEVMSKMYLGKLKAAKIFKGLQVNYWKGESTGCASCWKLMLDTKKLMEDHLISVRP